ncbi:uncharacterized protein LOC133498993 [Syngnathoides biaculeatus]|uniref:uncharacterized protein LOC133498993 n=1 Tax=Syngnathoides biaculeatus TaxID=300417 RepID=UPI002ADDAF03|nr:uncharacterized protein LOC133498993 [Syngnathoides biaculeatus]XP_061672406.1 uncharacterized protein LOC133498993 [Syngnathoides biaculeatus]
MSVGPRDGAGRLDDALSRIATETRQIRELERQLTYGRTLADELPQEDPDGILGCLPKYLRGLRLEVSDLQAENEALQRRPEATRTRRRRLTDSEAPAALKTEARALERQKAELEAELRNLREELNPRFRLGQRPSTYQKKEQKQPDRNRVAQLEDRVTRYRDRVVRLRDRVTRYRDRVARPESGKPGSVAHGRTSCRPSGDAARVRADPSASPPRRHTDKDDSTWARVCGEVRCVERTLEKRRAELREADRRLTAARARLRSQGAGPRASCRQTAPGHSLFNRILCDKEAELGNGTRAERRRPSREEAELRNRDAASRELCAAIHKLSELTSACREDRARLDRMVTRVAPKTASEHPATKTPKVDCQAATHARITLTRRRR